MRFPGFEGEWEEKRFGDLVEFKITNSFSRENLNYINGTVKNIHYGDIHTKFPTLFDITKEKLPYINNERSIERISESNYCQEGDIVFADASEDLNDVGKSIEIVNLNNERLLSGLHTLLARPKKNVFHKGFVGYLLKSNKIRTQIQKESQGSKVLSISTGRISKIELSFPSITEQSKIESLLSSIDLRIQTQNKIIEKLETLIKGISDDLFSQKFRFSKFPEDWPMYDISDFLEFFSTNSLSWENLEYRNSSFLNLHYGLIHQGLPIQIDLTECYLPGIKTEYLPNNYTLCQEGDVAFADASEDTNDVAKVVEFINCDNKKIVCGLHTIHARDKLNITVTGFKGYAFSSKLFRNQIRQLAQGTKVFSVSTKTFKECSMNIPSKNEQLKITNILSLIDRKIAGEKKLLAQFNQQKVYLLQNLFI